MKSLINGTTRRLVLVLAIAAAAIAIAGCGGGSSSSGTTAAPTTGSSTTAAASDGNSELVSLLPKDLQESGKINVGFSPQYPPYGGLTESGELTGFDYELLNAIFAKLELEPSFHQSPFDNLITGVQSGRFEVAGGALSDTAERRKQVDFVDYLGGTASVFYTSKDNPGEISTDILSACGKNTGYARGSFGEYLETIVEAECTKAGEDKPHVTTFENDSQTRIALQSGQIDYSITASSVFASLNEEANGEFESFLVKQLWSDEPTGFAVTKGATELEKAMQAAVDALIKDGTYASLIKKWHLENDEVKHGAEINGKA